MSLRRATYCLSLLLLLAACNKAPDGVISENKMARLIVDLNKAEYYIETHGSEFANDSTRMALKQSIYAKHGIDQELYDHSLEWYAHNMDVYIEVCDRAMRQLEDEKRQLNKQLAHQPEGLTRTEASPMTTYASHGDTADVWTGQRSWLLTAGMHQGYIRWDLDPDSEHLPGDKYMLRIKVKSCGHGMTATMAADYSDGSTTTVTRPLSPSDWSILTLQTDTLRTLRRVYGYIRYDMRPLTVALVDSVSLLRTHLDRNSYLLIGSQTTVSRQGGNEPAAARPAHAVIDSHELRDRADDRARGAFRPKPGVHKSSHERHITTSPNARHLPK